MVDMVYPGDVEESSAERPYNKPHLLGPNTAESLLQEAETANPHTMYFDLKFDRSRELLVFMEETKIWQDWLQDCVDQAGVNSGKACKKLCDIVTERVIYYNSNFNAAMRPQLSPGIPLPYERIISKCKDQKTPL